MTLPDALNIVIARTGVERYRYLCSEANTLPSPNDRETWRAWIMSEAQRDPSLPDITVSSEEMREAEQWPPRVKPCGGCP